MLFFYEIRCNIVSLKKTLSIYIATVLPAKSDSEIMFCLQSYQGLIINR